MNILAFWPLISGLSVVGIGLFLFCWSLNKKGKIWFWIRHPILIICVGLGIFFITLWA